MRREDGRSLPADTKDPEQGFWAAYRASTESKRNRFSGWIKLLAGLLLTGVGASAMSPLSPLAAIVLLGIPLVWIGLLQTVTGRRHSVFHFLRRRHN
ncbi:MAG: hypothetical protein ACT4OG_00225 [Alphaproteobacteria bacterium]